MSQPVQMKVFCSEETCWRCGGFILRLEPDYGGWKYYCQPCSHVTSTRAELERGMRQMDPQAVGIVVALSVRFTLGSAEQQ